METQREYLLKIPVTALNDSTRAKLSCMLNKPKVLMSSDNFLRDYRGLVDLMHIEYEISHWVRENDHVRKLLSLWSDKEKENATLGKLQNFFEKIDRYDVLDDTFDLFVRDAEEYERTKNNIKHFAPSRNILTIDDVYCRNEGKSFQKYDAFVLYVDDDKDFAEKIIFKLESEPYKHKLCEGSRDLITGNTFEHDAIIELISKRCYKLIVILSTEFLNSERHIFFMKFAQTLALGGDVKIVPCVYKDCELPDVIRALHLLDYRRKNEFVNFWKKLSSSIVPIHSEYEIAINLQPAEQFSHVKNVIQDEKTSIKINLPNSSTFECNGSVFHAKNSIQDEKTSMKVNLPNSSAFECSGSKSHTPSKNKLCKVMKFPYQVFEKIRNFKNLKTSANENGECVHSEIK